MTPTTDSFVKPVNFFTRAVFVLAALFATIAGIQLYIFTTRTDEWFAWTIAAPLSAAFLGAGFWAGAILVLNSARERAWANIRISVAAVVPFILLMVVATFLHLDRFHLDSPILSARISAWAWLIVYLAVPFLFIAVLIAQWLAAGGDPPRLAPMSPLIRIPIALNAIAALLVGLALYVFPDGMAKLWAWALTPLTARVIGAGFITLGSGLAQAVREGDWSRLRAGAVPYALLGGLQLLALARFPETAEWGRLGTWLYVIFITAVFFGGLYSVMAARRAARKTAATA